ncbi:MAG: phosphatase PAP2 family protein [Pseudomonadota bacterium]
MNLARFLAQVWQRHRWSVPLSLGAAIFFVRLASEVNEHELDAFDSSVQQWVDGVRGPGDALMIFMTDAGSVLPMLCLTLIALILLLAARRRREVRFLLVSALGCLALNVLLKSLFHRARPGAELPYLLARPTSWSFPSGHTMGAVGVVGSLVVIVRVLRPARVVWVPSAVLGSAWIVGVALSRVYLGAHYPSDVLGGLFAAFAWLSAVTGWAYPRLLPHERTTAEPH